jgi:hypothetical protein
MSRRRQAEVRVIQPDLVYNDVIVSSLINRLMERGKKNLASKIFYGACRLIQDKSGQEPMRVFKSAFDNIKPRVEVRSRRVGGSTLPCVGWLGLPTPAQNALPLSALQEKSLMLPKVAVGQLRRKMMSNVWQKLTVLTRIIAGNLM